LASPTNIRLGSKGLSGTNTLAHLLWSSVTKKNVFFLFLPGLNVIKLLTSVIYEFL
jgi:hypothetical protein